MKNVEQTIWSNGDSANKDDLETKMFNAGVFQSIDTMFPAKTNTAFDRKLKAVAGEKKDAVKFLSGNKSRSLSKYILRGHIPLLIPGTISKSFRHCCLA